MISGLDQASANGSLVVHAGTALGADAQVISSGGRVLSVVGTGPDLESARGRAYDAIAKITLAGSFYRSDIALAASQLAVR